MEASQSSIGLFTETLDRGLEILQGIANVGVVKEELPEDEQEIISQIEAGKGFHKSDTQDLRGTQSRGWNTLL